MLSDAWNRKSKFSTNQSATGNEARLIVYSVPIESYRTYIVIVSMYCQASL